MPPSIYDILHVLNFKLFLIISKPFANHLVNTPKPESRDEQGILRYNYDTICVKGDKQNSTGMPEGSEIMLSSEQLLLLPGH